MAAYLCSILTNKFMTNNQSESATLEKVLDKKTKHTSQGL